MGNKLEKLQLEAARIVTGLPIFTKTDSLYFETGWEPLYSRRPRRKLQYFLRARSTLRHEIMLHLNVYDWRYWILIYH
jgi:hypothetical protein